jgi:hypothetical protein
MRDEGESNVLFLPFVLERANTNWSNGSKIVVSQGVLTRDSRSFSPLTNSDQRWFDGVAVERSQFCPIVAEGSIRPVHIFRSPLGTSV